MPRAAMQNSHGMAGLKQLGDEPPADEQCSSNDQDFHLISAKPQS
jgi:hypothetical protein